MRYEGSVCPVCGKAFTEDDDIVVCPDCGTPQHRHCWHETGHCINASLHSEGFAWQMEENAEVETVPTQKEPSIVCPICKHENPPASESCTFCGQKFTLFGYNVVEKQSELEREELSEATQESQQDYQNTSYGYNSTAPSIDGVSADDISEYVRINHHTYFRKFDRLSNGGKKISWNWAALIFTPYWFFYRKLIKPGIIFLMSLLCISVIFSQPIQSVSDEYYDYMVLMSQGTATEQQQDAALQKAINEASKQAPFIVAYSALSLLARIIAAFIADRLYKKKAVRDIKILRSKNMADEFFHLSMFKVGGTAPFLVVAALVAEYAMSYLVSFIMTLNI